MKINRLTINLIYVDDFGSRWRLDILREGKGYISPEHLNTNAFFDTLGGIELIFDGYNIFYQSFDYHDLLDVVTFLLHSLVSLNILNQEEFNEFNLYKNNNVVSRVFESSGDELLLKKADDNELLSISYLKQSTEGNKVLGRNNFYFNEILVETKIWTKETISALNDYFYIVRSIIEKEINLQNNKFLKDLCCKWEKYFK